MKNICQLFYAFQGGYAVSCIRYFVGCDCESIYNENRDVSPAAISKAGYIIECLNELGYNVDVVSNAPSKNLHGIYRGHKLSIGKKNNLYITPSLNSGNIVFRYLNRVISNMWLIFWGILNIQSNEQILCYHGLNKIPALYFLKSVKKIHIILEVEEIYGSFESIPEKYRMRERKFLDAAEKYIFITNQLNSKINMAGKPYCILNGIYRIENITKCEDESIIRVVYAGTFNKDKGGVFKAIEVMRYLPDEYELLILGFGTEDEVSRVKNAVEEAKRFTGGKIKYIGLKRGEEFSKIIKSCDIGLSCQNSEGSYNETSFPSKILMYLCYGLKVVSVKIPVVFDSEVSEAICFYDSDDPQDIAEAVLLAVSRDMDYEDLFEKLHKGFVNELDKLVIDLVH